MRCLDIRYPKLGLRGGFVGVGVRLRPPPPGKLGPIWILNCGEDGPDGLVSSVGCRVLVFFDFVVFGTQLAPTRCVPPGHVWVPILTHLPPSSTWPWGQAQLPSPT